LWALKRSDRHVLLLSLAFAASSLASNIIAPIWPLYIRFLGASVTQLGLVFSVSNGVSAIFQLMSGALSDKYGRRRLHIAGAAMAVLPPLMYSYAVNWTELIPWVVLAGLAPGIYVPMRYSIVADASTSEGLARAYGWANTGLLAGFVLGPLIGGAVADMFGIRAPFLLCFIFFLGNVAITATIRETLKERSKVTTPIDRFDTSGFSRTVLTFSMVNIVQGIGIGIFTPISPIFAVVRFSVDMTMVGLMHAIGFGVASLIVQVPGGKLAPLTGKRRMVLLTILFSAPFFAMFGWSKTYIQAVVFMFIGYAILNASWPAFQALMMDLTPSHKWGLMNGISAATWWFGSMIGAGLSGALWESFGIAAPYFFSAFGVVCSAVPAYFIREPRSTSTAAEGHCSPAASSPRQVRRDHENRDEYE